MENKDDIHMNTYFKITSQLDHFSMNMEYEFESGVLVVQGESGAGKTTLLNFISGLKNPEVGKIAFGEQIVFDHIDKINIPTRHRKIGYVFQNYALFPNMTVEENITYGIKNLTKFKDNDERKNLFSYCESVMNTFHINHLKKKYPRNISGGEKQRVALSRAIVTKPKLLLLDEPFSALDEKTKKIVYKEFEQFKQNFHIPTILITHSPLECEMFADQKIVLENGKRIN